METRSVEASALIDSITDGDETTHACVLRNACVRWVAELGAQSGEAAASHHSVMLATLVAYVAESGERLGLDNIVKLCKAIEF